ncbi:hypothetical protein BD626DRAFT_519730 [Schizophyllum amplum]|uniref:Uncharacterized protein n=1 Tax=Schizophyllum amplum TaxID=97359 RepID=A0A550BV39_9AGAR|nr:hypothetical protein BD626DRAFT_519730 [Auriculariopsis ampla]
MGGSSTRSVDNELKPTLSRDHHVTLAKADIDTAAELVAGRTDVKLDPETAARLRRKIDWHIMPLFCLMYLYVPQHTYCWKIVQCGSPPP